MSHGSVSPPGVSPAPPAGPSVEADTPVELIELPLGLGNPELDEAKAEYEESYYVQAADEMIAQVEEHERFLFDPAELDALERFAGLPYEARYLFIRLYLRTHKWLRVQLLKYDRDIPDLPPVVALLTRAEGEVEDLPKPEPEDRKPLASTSNVIDLTEDDEDVVDLTLSDYDEDEKPKPNIKRSQTPPTELPTSPAPPDYSRLAYDTRELLSSSPEDLLKLLSTEEIVTLGKKLKVDVGRGKANVSS